MPNLRDASEFMLERGIVIRYERIREGGIKFGLGIMQRTDLKQISAAIWRGQ